MERIMKFVKRKKTKKRDSKIHEHLRTDVKQIRLLELQPSVNTKSHIMGTARHVDLELRPGYEAISWYWGEPPFDGSMSLNGVQITIPKNLEQALRQFRFSDHPRTLWVDAVCIDQDNRLEREAQIKIMGDIYSAATRTLVWLGPMETPEDQSSFKYWVKLSQGMSLRRIMIENIVGDASQELWPDIELNSERGESYLYDERAANNSLLDTLSRFLGAPWWTRLWVLQEVALASETQIFWGCEHMNFTEVTSACDTLLAEYRTGQIFLDRIISLYDIFDLFAALEAGPNSARQIRDIYEHIRSTEGSMSQRGMCFLMIEILVRGRLRKASLPHDSVYGLLGLIPHVLRQKFQPSYAQSVHETYWVTAYQILDLSRSFMLFNCILHETNQHPSWCPHWDISYIQRQDFRLRAQQEPLFQACDNVGWHLNIKDSIFPRLEVKGFRLDIIRRHCHPNYNISNAAYLYFYIEECVRCMDEEEYGVDQADRLIIDQIRNNRYITRIGILEAISRIALNDCEPTLENGHIRRLRDDNRHLFEKWISTADKEEMSRAFVQARRRSGTIPFDGNEDFSLCGFAYSVGQDKVFFTTKLGYAGLVFERHGFRRKSWRSAHPLEVWILAGGSQPVILQPADEGYYVHGEAYVQGVMDGEAVRGEVPVLPEDGDPEPILSDLQNGRDRWPRPKFETIYLL